MSGNTAVIPDLSGFSTSGMLVRGSSHATSLARKAQSEAESCVGVGDLAEASNEVTHVRKLLLIMLY